MAQASRHSPYWSMESFTLGAGSHRYCSQLVSRGQEKPCFSPRSTSLLSVMCFLIFMHLLCALRWIQGTNHSLLTPRRALSLLLYIQEY